MTSGTNDANTTELRGLDPHAGGPVKRGKKQRGIAKNQELIERVALAKFPPHLPPHYRSDGEVARIHGLSVQAVGPLVEAAMKQGIVAPVYNIPHEQAEAARLESAVCAQYDLRRVILVPGLPEMLGALDVHTRRTLQTHVVRSMARCVAEYLDTQLSAAMRERAKFTLGVAWGRTMRTIAEHLQNRPGGLRVPGLEVVPIVGITSESMREATEANVIAMRFAEAYKGQSSQLACPAFVSKLDASIVRRLEQVQRMLKRLPACRWVVTSMGPIPKGSNAAANEITLSADPVLNGELFKAAQGRAVGEVCGWLFDENGHEVETDLTAIGLGFRGLKTMAADPQRQVILVAGGDRRRIVPLRAALRARLASVLVSDTVTARVLLGETEQPPE